jgi:hypothetical protein
MAARAVEQGLTRPTRRADSKLTKCTDVYSARARSRGGLFMMGAEKQQPLERTHNKVDEHAHEQQR